MLLSERNMSSTVNGISRIESQSEYGVGLVKVYFQPGTNIATAIAQIVSSSQTAIKAMPPGITPPYVIQSNASNVPVAQVTMSSADDPRTGHRRLRPELPALTPVHHPRAGHAATLWRQDPGDHDRCRPQFAEQQGIGSAGRTGRVATVQHHPPGGNRADWRSRVRRRDELEPAQRVGLPRHSDQGSERRRGDDRRRRAGARWVRRADEHRAGRRPPRGVPDDSQEGRRVDAGGRRGHASHAPTDPRGGSARPRCAARLRPVEVRAGRHRRRGARSD